VNDRRALVFIFCTVTLDVLAVGVMLPVLPTLVLSFMGGNTAGAAEAIGVFATVWGLMQFLCSPLLGALSDRYGRRPVILISCLGLGLDYIFMAVAPSLTWLLVGRIISGITSATLSTAFAYITDVTPPDGRAKAFGIVGIAFGLGFIVGPAIGGLLGGLDPRLPFWVSAAACLANAAFGWFVLPESLPPERRMPFTWKRASPVARSISCVRAISCLAWRRSTSWSRSPIRCCRRYSCSTPAIDTAGTRPLWVLRWPSSASARQSYRAC
jgi:DHA1 family tetracycline resistance protein-like MFS transporter